MAFPLRMAETFLQLAPARRRAVVEAIFLIPACRVALRTLGADRTLRFIASRPVRTIAPELAPAAYGWLLLVVSRRMYPTSKCLVRSLALAWMLRRHGIDGEVCLGARKDGEKMAAHAWVEVGGTVVNDSEDIAEQFTPFGTSTPQPTLPPS